MDVQSAGKVVILEREYIQNDIRQMLKEVNEEVRSYIVDGEIDVARNSQSQKVAIDKLGEQIMKLDSNKRGRNSKPPLGIGPSFVPANVLPQVSS